MIGHLRVLSQLQKGFQTNQQDRIGQVSQHHVFSTPFAILRCGYKSRMAMTSITFPPMVTYMSLLMMMMLNLRDLEMNDYQKLVTGLFPVILVNYHSSILATDSLT